MKNIEQFERISLTIQSQSIRNIYLLFAGPSGRIYCKVVCADELVRNTHVSFLNGISINGKIIDEFEKIDGSEWMVILPDLETFSVLPWVKQKRQRAAVMLCSIKGVDYDIRALSQKIFNEYKALNIEPVVGTQLSYNVDVAGALGAYQDYPDSKGSRFLNDIVAHLMAAGIDVEYYMPYEHQTYRIDMVPDLLYKNIDKLILSKFYLQSYAHKKGYLLNDCTPLLVCPFHMSLWDNNKKNNLFFAENDVNQMSELGYHFIAGILSHYAELKAIMDYCQASSTQQTGAWSSNRDNSLIHIPLYFNEKKKVDRVGWSKRCLFQAGNFNTNHMVLIPCVYAAGLDGIKNQLPLSQVQKEGAAEESYLAAFQHSSLYQTFLGDALFTHIRKTVEKTQEGFTDE